MNPKRILVTGGAGYIGSHTAKELIRRGYETITLDNLSTGHRDFVQGADFIEVDLRDIGAVRKVFAEQSIDAVVHFAASCYVGESVEKPLEYYENNVLCGLHLLAAMIEHRVKCFIFSSTCAVYGNPVEIPITEEHAQLPINPYGQTKSLFEDILASHERLHGIRSVSLRYFNAAGCDPEGDIGEKHDPETHLIPLTLDAALGAGPALRIFGNDYGTPDGTCVRDYVHVCDLADAHILCLEHLLDGGPSNAYNLGTGKGYSVREIIEAAERIAGCSVPHIDAPRRPGDPPELVAGSEKIKRDLGWSPRHSSIDEILATAWNWQQKLRSEE